MKSHSIFILAVTFLHIVGNSYTSYVHFLMRYYNQKVLFDIIQDRGSNNLMDDVDTLLHSKRTVELPPTFLLQYTPTDQTRGYNSTVSAILRTRWKAQKWRFQHVPLISSSHMGLVSKYLDIYGPNVSESSDIFVILSETVAKGLNETQLFQRDVIFRKMYAALYILKINEALQRITMQLICPLCPNSLAPVSHQFSTSHSPLSPIKYAMKRFDEHFNRKSGHGSIAKLCQIGFRGHVDETNPAFHNQLEINAWRKYDLRADKDGVALGMMMNFLNFTFEMEKRDKGTELGNYSGIYLNPGGDQPTFYTYGRYLTYSYRIDEHLLYCRKVAIISATGWDFLWSPFDLPTWGFTFLTGTLFVLFHEGKISYGLDVFWCSLGLPPTSDWRRSKLLSCFLVVLINLNIGYLSEITSKVIIPNKEPDVESPEVLFREGFRVLDSNLSSSADNCFNFWHPILSRVKVNSTEISDLFVQVDSCTETHNIACIAKWAGLGTGLIYASNKERTMLQAPSNMRDRCHTVKSPVRNYPVTFYSQGPLAASIYTVHHIFIENGMDSFWDKLGQFGSYYSAYRRANHSMSENGDPPKLNFETPILVVFKAYVVLISVSLAVFLLEVGIKKVIKVIKKMKQQTHVSPLSPEQWLLTSEILLSKWAYKVNLTLKNNTNVSEYPLSYT